MQSKTDLVNKKQLEHKLISKKVDDLTGETEGLKIKLADASKKIEDGK